MKFKVSGRHKVAGVEPGGVVVLPSGPATDALIQGGHIKVAARAVPTKTVDAVTDEEVK